MHMLTLLNWLKSFFSFLRGYADFSGHGSFIEVLNAHLFYAILWSIFLALDGSEVVNGAGIGALIFYALGVYLFLFIPTLAATTARWLCHGPQHDITEINASLSDASVIGPAQTDSASQQVTPSEDSFNYKWLRPILEFSILLTVFIFPPIFLIILLIKFIIYPKINPFKSKPKFNDNFSYWLDKFTRFFSFANGYAKTSGRSSRHELIAATLVTSMIFVSYIELRNKFGFGFSSDIDGLLKIIICGFMVLVPTLIAVTVRRLHDINLSGYWAVLCLTPAMPFFIGALAVIGSQSGENRFGINPNEI